MSSDSAAATDKPVDVKPSDSENEEKIVQDAVKQITFYLSDSNLPYDKFLFTQAQKTLSDSSKPLGTGWIPLSTLLSFKRMQDIVSKSTRPQTICEFAIVEALKVAYPASEADALIEVSQKGDEVRRKKELVPPGQTGQMDRSIYAKGFPEGDSTDDDDKSEGKSDSVQKGLKLQKDLEEFFTGLGVGKVNAVRMRRDEQKKFKGSVFVEFATLESAKAVVDMEDKPTFPGQSEAIQVMFKKAYVEMKAKEKGFEPKYDNPSANSAAKSRDNNQSSRPFNAFRDWGKAGAGRQNGSGGSRRDAAPKEVKVFVEGKEMDVDIETGKLKNPDQLAFTSGKIARFSGASKGEESNPMDLKRALQSILPPAFVEYEKGQETGVVFFKDVIGDDKMQSIKDADLTLGGDDDKLSWTLLSGDEEKDYHLARAHKRASIALADAKAGGGDSRDRRENRDRDGGRGGGRGGRGRGRGSRGGGRGGSDRRAGRDNDRNRERDQAESKKRPRDDADGEDHKPEPSKPKGNSISVPGEASAPPTASEPAAKKVKTEMKTEE